MTGFEVEWSTSGASQTRVYGDCTTNGNTYVTFPIGNGELMHYATAIDTDDIEGIMF